MPSPEERPSYLDAHDGLWKEDPGAISTFTGRRMNPLHLEPEDVCIEDIAHALSRQCRYNGHVGYFLSVARHSIWVSTLLIEQGHPDLALTGLLHDAAEAYLGDLVRPLKMNPELKVFREADERAEEVIAKAFDLPYPMPPEVMEADRIILIENELPKPGGARWVYRGSPAHDKADFMAAYADLTTT